METKFLTASTQKDLRSSDHARLKQTNSILVQLESSERYFSAKGKMQSYAL